MRSARTRPLPLLLLAAAFFVAAPGETTARQNSDPGVLDLEMYFELQSVGNPQISPDGRQIIYSRGWIDKRNDRRRNEMWIMNADGTRKRFLTEGGSASWSPDGTRIAFTRSGPPGGSQIHIRWMTGEGAGSESQITRLERSPSGIQWSPDGEYLSFTMGVPDPPRGWNISMPSRPSGADWTPGPRIVEREVYRRDGQGYVDETYSQIFVVSAEGGAVRQLTDGAWNHSSPRWTADSRELLFSGLREEDAARQWRVSQIYSIDVASGEIRQLTDRHGQDGGPVPSPDGRLIAYTGDDWHDNTYQVAKIHLMNRDGSNQRVISGDFDRAASGMTWAADGSGLYFTADWHGSRNLHFISVNGDVRQLSEGEHMLSLSSMSDNGTMAVTISSPHEPGDIYTLRPNQANDPTRLTSINADLLTRVDLGEVEEIWYKSVDDLDVQGWIVKPPDFDPSNQYPMMLAIHGGPHAMYNVSFNYGWQEHAANGYVILYTNPRGSSGYGSAFGNEINNAYPSKDYDDLMAGVDAVIDRGYIDESRMYVYGCSGGGVLTAWVVGHTDRFAAASSNCPVINWLSFVGTTDGIGWFRNFESFPWDDPTEHLERSPLMYVGNVTTPTMLMTGENDLRTPMAQSEEYYAALKILGVPTALLRFQNEAHGTTRNPTNFVRTQLYLRSWFERWGGPPTPVTNDQDR